MRVLAVNIVIIICGTFYSLLSAKEKMSTDFLRRLLGQNFMLILGPNYRITGRILIGMLPRLCCSV